MNMTRFKSNLNIRRILHVAEIRSTRTQMTQEGWRAKQISQFILAYKLRVFIESLREDEEYGFQLNFGRVTANVRRRYTTKYV